MRVVVDLLGCNDPQKITIDAVSSVSIDLFKVQIWLRTGVPPEEFRLMWFGRSLLVGIEIRDGFIFDNYSDFFEQSECEDCSIKMVLRAGGRRRHLSIFNTRQ